MVQYARTLNFLLGAATVMVGAPDELWDLRPDKHSLGLIKNFTFRTDPTHVTLSHGLPAQPVYSVQTGENTRISAEVYEFTARNLTYALGQIPDQNLVPQGAFYPLAAQIDGNDYTPVTTLTFTSAIDVTGDFLAGDWIVVQEAAPFEDRVFYAKLSANATAVGSTHTLSFTNYPAKEGHIYTTNARVGKVNELVVSARYAKTPYVSAKIVGVLPSLNIPIVICFPKVRLTHGFDFTLNEGQFANLPFEFLPLPLMATDTFYSEFGGGVTTKIFVPKIFEGFPRYPNNQIHVESGARIRLRNRTFIVRR